MPLGMGWLVDVRDLIMENPLWLLLVFLFIISNRRMVERLERREAQQYEEQFDNPDDYYSEDAPEENKKWYKKLFNKNTH